MIKPDAESGKTKPRWRRRINRIGAGLTHGLFALTIILAVVKSDAPWAGFAAPDETAALGEPQALPPAAEPEAVEPPARMAAADPAPQPADSGRAEEAAPAASALEADEPPARMAAADPAPQPADAGPAGEAATPSGSRGEEADESEELILAQRRRKQRQEEKPAEAAPVRAPTEEEKARFRPLLDRLVAAYPDSLAGHDGVNLLWKDGTSMPFDDGKEKSFTEKLEDADLEDQFSIAYAPGAMLNDPEVDSDPGRIRNEAFFRKMYGNCRRKEVEKQLVPVKWLPTHGGKTVRITSVNDVAGKLQQVSDELDKLPPELLKYLQPVAGTYNCRDVSRTGRASAHGYGIAIDINAKFGDYWQWGKPRRGRVYRYRNQIPWEIVEVFERHGFIWGGKWYHFDTLHFEYRPELLSGPVETALQPPGEVPMPEKQPRNLN